MPVYRLRHLGLRHVSTAQERRRWFQDITDCVRIRFSRSPGALPDVNDDIPSRPQRCWKSYRRYKWRASQ